MHLWHVPPEDDIVKNALREIEEILEGNNNAAQKALSVYDDYLFILREEERVKAFLEEQNHTREEMMAEVKKYEDTIAKIRNEMPIEIRMNMYLIDCIDLNKHLCLECQKLIDMILNKTADMVYERAQNIAKSLETIKDNISQKASTADMLVQIETYLEKAKLEDKIDYTN